MGCVGDFADIDCFDPTLVFVVHFGVGLGIGLCGVADADEATFR